MIYRFDTFELDGPRVELRQNGETRPVERQVFALLLLLAENHERMLTKDEIIEKIWDGRIVSESALTSRVKSARQALGDDGKTQRYIKTIHGQGFRFVGDVKIVSSPHISASQVAPVRQAAAEVAGDVGVKPSIAVLPFRLVGVAGAHGAIADALPHELIGQLSRLRWLFVIARASSFQFRGADPDLGEIGRALSVRYCLSGMVEIAGDKIVVSVELADTRDGGVVWADRYAARLDDIYDIRTQIAASITAAMEIQIPAHEASLVRDAQRRSGAGPENLDAWSAYHIGLQHLYRFTNKDNAAATAMFERAATLAPDFARAHAGLSSTYFQNAFLAYRGDRAGDALIARRCAERAVELDPLDPFSNFAMGRVHWVEDNIAGGIGWLDRSIAISPNYAQGVYARGWADAVAGRSDISAENIELALKLSPLDPFRYAMIGVRAFTHISRGEDAIGAAFAEEAANTPGAHVMIAMIAVAAHEMNGDRARAQSWAENVRARNPAASQKDFFNSFPFEDVGVRARFSEVLGALGF